ncbi:sulfite exporter TauE/SafE family protein [Kribbella pittospori]|uniref:Probable membrane transporter protein n=1 Tax=Kribbella pittospori TaxID=722689 RepID=A0A4R0KUT1_9ACTN|nr:sulfite exporter TauE/SafE family protein [Kribbella pittospori]TCC64783.1 sulfite exporter TauE/SafE family protein [Kribbella pittospori]
MILLAGVAAGALNAVGGGGSFVALSALVATGMPPVTANATTTVALLPGNATIAWVYRRELEAFAPPSTLGLTLASVLGGAIGAGLLLVLPSASFDAAVPWLLAFATVVLAFGRRLTRALRLGAPGPAAILAGQFLLSIYGGYFGGAVGLMMLAFWTATTTLDPARGNPLRVIQVAAVYLTATVIFLFAADVLDQPIRLVALLVGAVVGGYAGAHLVRRLPASLLKALVLTTAVAMTALFFVRAAR